MNTNKLHNRRQILWALTWAGCYTALSKVVKAGQDNTVLAPMVMAGQATVQPVDTVNGWETASLLNWLLGCAIIGDDGNDYKNGRSSLELDTVNLLGQAFVDLAPNGVVYRNDWELSGRYLPELTHAEYKNLLDGLFDWLYAEHEPSFDNLPGNTMAAVRQMLALLKLSLMMGEKQQ